MACPVCSVEAAVVATVVATTPATTLAVALEVEPVMSGLALGVPNNPTLGGAPRAFVVPALMIGEPGAPPLNTKFPASGTIAGVLFAPGGLSFAFSTGTLLFGAL